MPESWHTKKEKSLIEEFGGTPESSFGVDGSIDDDPVEVRVAKTETRFRLNKDTHRDLVRNDGSYIFDDVTDNKPPKEVEADKVQDILGRGSWYSDRGYMHRFIDVDSIF